MTTAIATRPTAAAPPVRTQWPRWLPLAVAALAMLATLPGRTHGLGLVTEPLLAELQLSRVTYGLINLWATLIGAAFCVPAGWLLDRVGPRAVLLGVALGLAAAVAAMARADVGWGVWLVPGLFALVLLTRGLGQSALSVVSLALMGRSAGRPAGLGVGVYSAAVSVLFMGAFTAIKMILEGGVGWRELWAGVGAAVGAFGVLAFALLPASRGEKAEAIAAGPGLTLGAALLTPAFWVFAGATSVHALIGSGISLFNQSILEERGFDRATFLTITAAMPLVGLAANLAGGALSPVVGPGRLMAGSMGLMTAALLSLPLVTELWQVYVYAAAMGVGGGLMTVVFFGVWGQAFGTAHLGSIQGAAQMMTVFASAAGPVLLAWAKEGAGSYVPAFQASAGVAALFAVAAWFCPMPRLGREG